MSEKPAPPRADWPYLAECKCPLNGAALEFWLLAVTGDDTSIPKRGRDDVQHAKLAFTPELLKLVAGGIHAASGLTVPYLLKPPTARAFKTAGWALAQLEFLAGTEEDSLGPQFRSLIDQLNKAYFAAVEQTIEAAE
jgi:hypothetical protein